MTALRNSVLLWREPYGAYYILYSSCTVHTISSTIFVFFVESRKLRVLVVQVKSEDEFPTLEDERSRQPSYEHQFCEELHSKDSEVSLRTLKALNPQTYPLARFHHGHNDDAQPDERGGLMAYVHVGRSDLNPNS